MLILTLLIIAAAVYLMVRGVEVRLVLLGAGLAMALLARRPLVITDADGAEPGCPSVTGAHPPKQASPGGLDTFSS